MNLRKLIRMIFLPLLLLLSLATLAQNKVITGRVTDAAGKGISGVSVSVKGQSRGTTTNETGSYSLSVPDDATTLVFSSVGFTTLEVPINGNKADANLAAAANSLNEVVVVGYGTVRKKDLTGAVTTVSAKDFQKGNITTPEQLIAGKVPGVSIVSNGGQPGSGSTIRIRGGSSLNASNDPLIVIDGVPLSNNSIAGASNPLSFINQNDIESFTVLKDASAAAIYGTRAANGVIIITTRKGKGGAFKVNFSSNNSVSRLRKEIPVLTGNDIRDLVSRYGSDKQKAQVGTANTDWQNEIYQTAFATDNNITFSGGVKWLPYRLTAGYLDQTGILRTDHFQKTSVSLALNPTFFDNHLKADISLKGSMQKTRFAAQGAIGGAVYFDPTQPVYSDNKGYGGYWQWREANGSLVLNRANNPVGVLEQTFDRQKPMRSIGNIQLDYKFHFLPELHANLNLGYDVSKNTGTVYVPANAATDSVNGGKLSTGKQTQKNTILDFYLNYIKDITAIAGRIDVTAGYSYNNFQTKNYNYRTLNANSDTIAGTFPPTFPFDIPQNTLISYFGRLNFNLLNKYLLTATVRRDGSSKFAPENRWGTFPSIALAWNIKNEPFLKSNGAFNDLKLRLGYGITGQQDGIGLYDYIASYNLGSVSSAYQLGGTYYQTYSPGGFNAGLKWEQTSTYNAAVDYGFMQGRINGSVDFYLKRTKDLLNTVAQPTGTNFALYLLTNVGTMENRGVEFNLNVQPVRNRTLTWDVNFNATYNKNEITNQTIVPDPTYAQLTGKASTGFTQVFVVGKPKNTFNLYRQIYDKDGKPIEGLLDDMNRDGVINDNDRYKSFFADPNWFFGFSTNVTYNKWNAGFVLRSSLNNYIYNNIFSNNGRLNQVLGNYTLGNASTNYLATGITGLVSDLQPLSDLYLEDGSFLRMDNAYIGYNFGKVYHNKATLRLSASAQNVFIITNYKGLDPEVNGGVDNTLYPRPRMFSLGLNLDF